MRLFVTLLATAMMFAAGAASAVDLALVGPSAAGSATINVGDQVTIELRIDNQSETEVWGLGASAHGYAGGLTFVGGRSVRRYLEDFDNVFITNLAGTPSATPCGTTCQRILAESAIGANGPRVQFALSALTAGQFPNAGSTAAGLGGTPTATAHFRLTFQGAAPGVYTILLDSSYQGDLVNLAGGGSEEIAGTQFVVTVVPEPGTALLMGLGLAGLAVAGRRE